MSCRICELPPEDYRPCVGLMVLDREGRILVGQRVDVPFPAWQMPQGGIDPGETPLTAALRELQEEVGIPPERVELLAESRVWRCYDLPPDLRRRVWGGRYRGQAQRWFAFRFLGSDADIRVDTQHPEFRAVRWACPEELLRTVVSFKRDVYESVLDEFRWLWERLAEGPATAEGGRGSGAARVHRRHPA